MMPQSAANLKITKFPAASELSKIVHFLYVIDVSDECADLQLKVPASLYFDLIIPIKGQLWVNPDEQPVSQAFVSPILQSFKDVQFKPGTLLLGIRILPGAFTAITGKPATDLLQRPNNAPDFFESDLIQKIIESFRESHCNLTSSMMFIQELLIKSWKSSQCTDKGILAILQTAEQYDGITAGELAQKLGRSIRWLQLKTKYHLGLSPKQFLEIKRVSQFLQHPGTNSYKSKLTEVGLELGYYDQAHFINSIKKISGESPSRLLSSELTLIKEFIY